MIGNGRAHTSFASAVVLVKREVFDALEACALAERALLRSGRPVEAAALGSLFEMLEDRLILDPMPGNYYVEGVSGSNSNERELTQ
jgi:hypothetical protein